MKTFYTLSIFLVLSINSNLSANCHYRGGYISFEQIGDLKFEVNITTFTFANSPIDRDSLELSWGDGTSEWFERTNEQLVGDNIQKNIYTKTHTYPGLGTYTLFMTDSLRCGANFSNNTNTPFCLESSLRVLDVWFYGSNDSPSFSVLPIDTACKDQFFMYNPNAIDTDNDSIDYSLSVSFCTQNYSFPNVIGQGNNVFLIHPETGLITWDRPTVTGDYAVSFIVREYRSGLLISRSNFEFTIPVVPCAVSTKDAKEELNTKIELFPNPTSSFVNLNLTFEQPTNTQIQILNNIGQIIETYELGEILHYEKQLDFSNFPKGLYFMNTILGNQSFIRKVVVN